LFRFLAPLQWIRTTAGGLPYAAPFPLPRAYDDLGQCIFVYFGVSGTRTCGIDMSASGPNRDLLCRLLALVNEFAVKNEHEQPRVRTYPARHDG